MFLLKSLKEFFYLIKTGSGCTDEKNFFQGNLDKGLIEKLSPLQQKIIFHLSEKPLTLTELSNKTNSSIYTIGKQLSMLQCRTKCNCLKKKGIDCPLIKKIKDEGIQTTYLINFSCMLKPAKE